VTALRSLFARFRRWAWGGSSGVISREVREERRKAESDVMQDSGGPGLGI
jgi:hypothetical protein